jgi:predicted SprT family Zn-dependent metalloprotease
MADLRDHEALANSLLVTHGLAAQWRFAWDRATTRFGQCDHRTQRITVSKHLAAAASDHDFEQVVLHEIAHALAGSKEGHGTRWLSIARRIGYTGGRTHHQEPATDRAKWQGLCPNGHEVIRFRKPGKPTSCSRCNPRFDRRHLIEWRVRDTYSTITSFQKQT